MEDVDLDEGASPPLAHHVDVILSYLFAVLEGKAVYQWESRHNIELKWAPAQRRQWTDEEGNDVTDPRVSDKPRYAPLVIADVTDKDGWIYAFDFAGLQSCHTEKMMDVEEATDFVRRRSWAPERSEAP